MYGFVTEDSGLRVIIQSDVSQKINERIDDIEANGLIEMHHFAIGIAQKYPDRPENFY